MKNYEYVLDVRTPFIKKLYDKENNYKVELLTPYETLEELKKIQEENTDLETKLAESEKELLQKEKKIEDLMLCEFVATTLDFNKLSADNCRLREQLADIEANKEKEINRICKTHIEANAQLKQQLAEKDKEITQRLVIQERDYNRDKISFALEQLEKVKELLSSKAIQITGTSVDSVRLYSINEIFNNQIKQLKEVK